MRLVDDRSTNYSPQFTISGGGSSAPNSNVATNGTSSSTSEEEPESSATIPSPSGSTGWSYGGMFPSGIIALTSPPYPTGQRNWTNNGTSTFAATASSSADIGGTINGSTPLTGSLVFNTTGPTFYGGAERVGGTGMGMMAAVMVMGGFMVGTLI